LGSVVIQLYADECTPSVDRASNSTVRDKSCIEVTWHIRDHFGLSMVDLNFIQAYCYWFGLNVI